MERRWILLLSLLALILGCSEETSSPAPAQPAPEARVTVADADPFPPADLGPLPGDSTPAGLPQTALVTQKKEVPPAPVDTAGVLNTETKAPDALEAWVLEAWVLDSGAAPQVRLASLQQLAAVAPKQALISAKALVDDPKTEPLLRSNAVAVLARSEDPKARELLKGLEPRYQRLAQALRDRKGR